MSEQTKLDGRTKRSLDVATAKRQVSQESYRAVLAGKMTLQQAKSIGRDGAPAADTARVTDGSGRPAGPAGRARSATPGDGQDSPDTPPQPVSQISKDDRTPTKTPCLCGCGTLVVRSFAPGHDARMFRVAREHLTEGRKLTKEQREYLENSGKMERVRTRLAEEEQKRQQRATKKGDR